VSHVQPRNQGDNRASNPPKKHVYLLGTRTSYNNFTSPKIVQQQATKFSPNIPAGCGAGLTMFNIDVRLRPVQCF